jgi:hypothetical protein
MFHLQSHVFSFGSGGKKRGGVGWGHYFVGNLHVSLRERTVCTRNVLSSTMNIHLQNKHHGNNVMSNFVENIQHH